MIESLNATSEEQLDQLQPDEPILDNGSRHALLVEDMAAVVDPSGSICGVDVSAVMIDLSQKRCSHLPQVELREGEAPSLPYNNDEFDVAVSTQVYEYIVQSGSATGMKIRG